MTSCSPSVAFSAYPRLLRARETPGVAEVTPIVVFFFDFFFLASAICVGASEATSEAASAEDDIEFATRTAATGANSPRRT